MDSATLTNEALKLPPLERAQIIDALWSSLDPAEQKTIDQAWLLESQDRLAAFRAVYCSPISLLAWISTDRNSPNIGGNIG
jgi:putative addiction module component (TIGR02574 family)